jgi:1L-myo-inositol 1-phosphate cytidylyltransferase
MTDGFKSASPARISDAVVLMAGSGSRLRKHGFSLAKPLVPICGRPLISYTFDALIHAGIRIVHAVVGFESDMLMARVQPLVPASLDLRFIINEDWEKQNGISVLVAANQVDAPFLLTMGDHLFDQSMMDLLVRDAVPDQLNLAVDRKLDAVFDPNDATKVQTQGDRILAIGKGLQHYDAIDTGLFVCPLEIFDYLEQAKSLGRRSDCSLADGIRLMAGDKKVRAIDIGERWWQDVDTPQMLQHAQKQIAAGLKVRAVA